LSNNCANPSAVEAARTSPSCSTASNCLDRRYDFVTPDIFGSIGEILGVLEEHLSEIDVQRLVSYAVRYGQDAAIKRLGYVLEELGADPEAIHPLHDAPIRGYRLLDPQGPDRGPYIAGWRLRDNLKGQ
jgi:predicted transcriptional regulator of viral defense system